MYQNAIVGKKTTLLFFENSQLIKIWSKYPLDLIGYLDLELGHKIIQYKKGNLTKQNLS